MSSLLDITTVIGGLIGAGNKVAQDELRNNQQPDGVQPTTTLRLTANVRRFYEIQAAQLGSSLQAILIATLTGVMEASINPGSTTTKLVAERFYTLFRAHGVTHTQIARLLRDFSITLSVLGDESTLLDRITPRLIQYLSGMFGINPAWLDAVDDQVTKPMLDKWHKNIYNFCDHLLHLSAQGFNVKVLFIKSQKAELRTVLERGKDVPLAIIGVVVKVERTILNEDGSSSFSFSTYERWDFEDWHDAYIRLELKKIIAFCSKIAGYERHIDYFGIVLNDADFENLERGRAFVADVLKKFPLVTLWNPEDFIRLTGESTEQEIIEYESLWVSYKDSRLDDLLVTL
jgi:hypothetical protein